jgi:hypothetical protein
MGYQNKSPRCNDDLIRQVEAPEVKGEHYNKPDSRFTNPKRESHAQNGNRIPLRCEIPSKVGHTSNGGGGRDDIDDGGCDTLLSNTVAAALPDLSHNGYALSIPKEATVALYLVVPTPVEELFRRLIDHGARFHYKAFLKVCVYLHNQLYKSKTQGLGGKFETSGIEARQFVKQLSINGNNIALPKVLDNIGVTRKAGKYVVAEQAQRREFAKRNTESFIILPHHPKWLNKIDDGIQAMFEDYCNRPELLHIKNSYNSLSYYEPDILEVMELYSLSKKSKKWGHHHKRNAEALLAEQVWYLRPKANFVYARVRSFPSSFRIKGFFDYNGRHERVCLVDIKSSHPTLLCRILRDYLLKQQNKGTIVDNALLELGEYQALVESGKMYEAIQGEERRKDSKLKFQKWLNGEGWHYQVINQWFEKEFAELFCIIRSFKDHDQYTPFHVHLRRLEAKIVMLTVGLFGRISIPAVPIIDELMVPESRGEDAAYKLQNIILDKTEIRGVLSVDYYDATQEGFAREVIYNQFSSFSGRTTTPCPADLCPHCWNENKMMRIESPFPCKHLKGKVAGFPIHPKGNTESDAG